MNKGWIPAIVVLILLVAVRVAINFNTKKSDPDQIREALAESIAASKEGRPGGVLELVGDQLKVNSQDASGAMSQVADFIKKQHPDVKFANVDPIVTGATAQITSPATVDVSFLGQHRTIQLKTVLLIFKKEPSVKWFVIPAEKWKLEQVEVPDLPSAELGG